MQKCEKIWLINHNGECIQVSSQYNGGIRYIYIDSKEYQMRYMDYFSNHAQLSLGYVIVHRTTWYMASTVMRCFMAR